MTTKRGVAEPADPARVRAAFGEPVEQLLADVRERPALAIGIAGLIVAISATGLALLLTALTPGPSRFLQIATVPSMMLFVVMPMAAIAYSARRCFQHQ